MDTAQRFGKSFEVTRTFFGRMQLEGPKALDAERHHEHVGKLMTPCWNPRHEDLANGGGW